MNYHTPLGAFEFWSDAADACERADLDPCTCIEYVNPPASPVSVGVENQNGRPSIRLSSPIFVF
jgi:hypothetical protein